MAHKSEKVKYMGYLTIKMFKDDYTTTNEADKTNISTDAYAIGEMIEKLLQEIKKKRL